MWAWTSLGGIPASPAPGPGAQGPGPWDRAKYPYLGPLPEGCTAHTLGQAQGFGLFRGPNTPIWALPGAQIGPK